MAKFRIENEDYAPAGENYEGNYSEDFFRIVNCESNQAILGDLRESLRGYAEDILENIVLEGKNENPVVFHGFYEDDEMQYSKYDLLDYLLGEPGMAVEATEIPEGAKIRY